MAARRKEESKRIGTRTLVLSNLDKVFYPEDGYTKGDVVEYYRRIAPTMLEHLRDRPVSMQRYPNGIHGYGFFHKDVPEHFPEWIERAVLPRKTGGRITHVLCNDAATLVYLANQGCLIPHVWLSRADRPDFPDRLIFDLDPPGESPFARVKECARHVREILEDELGLTPFLMLTGSRGVHVTVPLDRKRGFDRVRAFASDVAALLARRHPKLMTVEHLRAKRKDRVYVDVARNGFAQTAVPPYSLRALPGAPVSVPITWSELERRGLHAQCYTLANVFRRVDQKGDPWKGIGRRARSLDAAEKKLEKLVR